MKFEGMKRLEVLHSPTDGYRIQMLNRLVSCDLSFNNFDSFDLKLLWDSCVDYQNSMNKEKNLGKLFQDILNKKENIPQDESIWLSEPRMAFLYAKYLRKARWSEYQEQIFYNDVKVLYHYINWIVNFLCEKRVPEHFHNYMLANSLSNDDSDKAWIELYFQNFGDKIKIK